MAEVKWIKITTALFDDEKIKLIEDMPEGDTILIIWFKLLAQAGKTNDNGFIYLKENIPYTEEMLSTVFRRPLNMIRISLQVFQQFGMIEIEDTQGIFISNWGKHQNIDGLDKIREQTRLRNIKYRERKKQELLTCDVTVTQYDEMSMISELKETFDIKEYIDIPVLIIDDLGKEIGTKWVCGEIYSIINKRYEDMKPTILTTENSLKDLKNNYAEKGKAILSRLTADFILISLTGEDYRRKRF